MTAWVLIDHVCKDCMGRLLASVEQQDGAPARFMCAQCGNDTDLEAARTDRAADEAARKPGKKVEHIKLSGEISICACSVRVGGRQVMTCTRVPNEERHTPIFPVVAARLKDAEAAEQVRMPRPVAGD